jgi:hypothetical protein
MKIQFSPKSIKLTRVALALIAISLAGYVAYAATTLSFSNTATITSGANILISQPTTTSFASCTGAIYTLTPSNVPWVIPQGGSAIQYFCIQNTGTGPTVGTFTFTLGTATGLSGTLTYTALAAGSATTAPVAYTVTSNGASAGGSFTIVVN